MDIRIPIIAIVGRPNVGKSTFFNRILGESRAVVEDMPGVTRDRNYGLVEAYRIPFYVVDTGGFEKNATDELQQHTSRQALLAVEEADAIIFLVDSKTGLQPGDEEVIEVLRQYDKPFSVVANKCDGKELEPLAAEFYQLGIDSVTPCSALHGRGVSMIIEGIIETLPNFHALYEHFEAQKEREKEILAEIEESWKRGSMEIASAEDWYEEAEEDDREEMREKKVIEGLEEDFPPVYDPDSGIDVKEYDESFAYLPLPGGNSESVEKKRFTDEEGDSLEHESEIQDDPIPCIRLALIGRPNVGKSTILNALTGEERAITSALAGTTRDSIHEVLTHEGQQFELIDTAGMRKKGRVGDSVEKYSVLRSMRAITACDVAVVVLDAVEGPSDQDAKIIGLAHEEGKGIIIAVNKWDLVVKDHTSVKTFEEKLRTEFKFVPYAPIYFISGKTGKRVHKILEASKEVAHARKKRISTMALNNLLRKELPRASTPSYRGRPLKLFYAAQVDVAPPRFMLVMNYPKQVHFSYLRFIKNTIRSRYGFSGTDIKLVTKKRGGGKKK